MPSTPQHSQQQAISVAEALNIVKLGLETIRLRVIGEVSGFTGNRYKVKYFSLKDKDTVMDCTVWGNVYDAAGVDLKDGLEIEVEGKFSVYPQRGKMSFHVSKIHIAGEGQMRLELAQRESRLRAEGLFDQAHKKPLPHYPTSVAVVTSGAGAVIHDITKTLARRWPIAQILLYSVRVEGKDAPQQIISGLQAADISDVDVVILARGGGSFEDLLPFSDEALVRYIATMNKPVVSGVGHEPDFSLADYVADLRAPTPTAAAEAVSAFTQQQLEQQLHLAANVMTMVLQKKIRLLHTQLDSLARRPVFSGPEALLQVRAMMLDSAVQRMTSQMARGFDVQASRLQHAQDRLERVAFALTQQRCAALERSVAALDALSPLKVFSRGYAAAFDAKDGQLLKSVDSVQIEQNIVVKLSDGQLDCEVKGIQHG